MAEKPKKLLSSTLQILVFVGLVSWNAKSLNRMDQRRRQIEQELHDMNAELEQHVAQRTLELQMSQARFAGILELASDAIVSIDADHHITLFNQEAEKIFGYSGDEVLGQSIDLLLPARSTVDYYYRISEFNKPFGNAKRMGEHRELFACRKDGTEFSAEVSISKLAIGDEIIFTAFIQDVSHRKLVEAALRNSEEQFRRAFEDASVGMAIVSLGGYWVKVNSAVCQIVGYSQPELLRLTFQDITHADDLEIDLAHVHQLLAGEISIYQMEKRYLHKQGHTVWVLLNVSLVRDEQGKPLQFISHIHNISDRKRHEEDRKRAEIILKRYERVVAATIDAICLLDKTYTHQLVNQAYLQWYQQPREALIGHTMSELLGTEAFNESIKDKLDQCLAGETIQNQLWIEASTAGQQFISGTYSPYYEADQTISGVVVSLRNITDLKQAEAALNQSQERLQLALEASGDGLWDWNIATHEVYFSPRYLEILGYAADEVPFSFDAWETLIHPDDKAWVFDKLSAHLRDNSIPYAFDYRAKTKSGEWKWVANFGKVVAYDDQGNPQRMTGMHKDISDRKQFELELQQAKEAAEAASQSKSVFLANMSHELRTPLNVILGFTQVLHRDLSLSSVQQETIQTIHRSGENLLSLINDILDLSKIEADRTLVEESNFDLLELLQLLEEMLRQRTLSKNLKFCFEIAPEVPQFIASDINKLRQILINLLSNAIKFTDRGGVTLRVKAESFEENNINAIEQETATALLVFEIEDTGVGIADDEIQGIFDAFVQSQSGKMVTGGTGLGLTISRQFAQLMNGEISVTSLLGQGSTFFVHLPVQIVAASSVPAPAPRRQLVGLAPGQPTYRVLIVDDQPENRLLLTRLMTQLGMDIQEATNGEEAVMLCQQWQPHLIWMDIRMPVLNGYEATQQICSLSADQPPIVIALTAQASMSDRNLAVASGCNDFITKPFNENLLYDKMAEHLDLQFVYAETPSISGSHCSISQSTSEPLTPESLADMPADWLAALYNAAQVCDEEDIEQLLQMIPDSHASIAHQLRQLTHDYQFGQIKYLLQDKIEHTR